MACRVLSCLQWSESPAILVIEFNDLAEATLSKTMAHTMSSLLNGGKIFCVWSVFVYHRQNTYGTSYRIVQSCNNAQTHSDPVRFFVVTSTVFNIVHRWMLMRPAAVHQHIFRQPYRYRFLSLLPNMEHLQSQSHSTTILKKKRNKTCRTKKKIWKNKITNFLVQDIFGANLY